MNADARIHSPYDRDGRYASNGDGRRGTSTARDGGTPLPGGVAVQLAAAPDAPTLARHAAAPALAHWRPELRDAAMLVISELVTNAVRHGTASVGEAISLRIRRRGATTRIEVVDPSLLHGRDAHPLDVFASSDRLAAESLRSDDQRTGWGLPIVAELTDRWGVERAAGRTCVWCEIDDA